MKKRVINIAMGIYDPSNKSFKKVTDLNTYSNKLDLWMENFDERKKYDDHTKYTAYELKSNNEILVTKINVFKEFPEVYTGEYEYLISTPIGIVVLQNKSRNRVVIYDMFAYDEDVNFNTIMPDFSILEKYNKFNNPTNYHIISFAANEGFIPSHQYEYNDQRYFKFDCEKINNKKPNDQGYFKNIAQTYTIDFSYKPLLSIRINAVKEFDEALTLEKLVEKGLCLRVQLSDMHRTTIFECKYNKNGEYITTDGNINIHVDNNNMLIIIDGTNIKYAGITSLNYIINLYENTTSGYLEVC